MENFPPGIKIMPGGLADSAKSCETKQQARATMGRRWIGFTRRLGRQNVLKNYASLHAPVFQNFTLLP
jgi:hypothetical protein